MKKLLNLAVVMVAVSIVVAFTSCSGSAQTKADLKTDIDSLSYAFGVANTQGIDGYLLQQGVDSSLIKEFIAGFMEGSKIDKKDKKTNARMLGKQIGMNVSSSIEDVSRNLLGDDSTKVLNKANLLAGFIDGVVNKNFLISREEATTYLEETSQRIKSASLEKQYAEQKAANSKFLEDNKGKEGVQVTASGLQYKVVKEGAGQKPTSADRVKVNYVGTKIDGTEFDSSIKRNEPFEFSLGGGVIQGWIEGVQLMNVGSKYIFYIPYDLAYGAQGHGGIEPFSTLIFEVELLEIVK